MVGRTEMVVGGPRGWWGGLRWWWGGLRRWWGGSRWWWGGEGGCEVVGVGTCVCVMMEMVGEGIESNTKWCEKRW